MAELSSKKWMSISHLIFRINESSSYLSFCKTFFSQVRTLIPYSKGFAFQITKDKNGFFQRRNAYTVVPEGEEDLNTEPLMDGTVNGSADAFLGASWSSVFKQSDIAPPALRDEDRIYKLLWEPQNLYYALHFSLIYRDEPVAIITLFRPKEASDFSEEEISMAEVLKNHMALKLYTLEHETETPGSDESLDAEKYIDFTPREREVIMSINAGKSNVEICREFYIEESTLRKHLYNIYRKTGAKNRAQLILWIRQKN